MAAPRSYFTRNNNYRFLAASDRDAPPPPISAAADFEFDESDVWSTGAPPRSASPEFSRNHRVGRKNSSGGGGAVAGAAASVPVNVPDWSKILKEEYTENRRRDSDGDGEDFGEDCGGDRVPPHEFLARQLQRARIASFSVHEGVGRTLKGRDLSKVRNAIWAKTGFQD